MMWTSAGLAAAGVAVAYGSICTRSAMVKRCMTPAVRGKIIANMLQESYETTRSSVFNL